jgi:hypothetical protein
MMLPGIITAMIATLYQAKHLQPSKMYKCCARGQATILYFSKKEYHDH